jgi:hypothetical protein
VVVADEDGLSLMGLLGLEAAADILGTDTQGILDRVVRGELDAVTVRGAVFLPAEQIYAVRAQHDSMPE